MEQARLVWFDVSSGEGQVQREADGALFYLHFTCIAGVGKNNWAWPADGDRVLLSNLKSGDACRISVYRNLYSERVEACDFTPPGVVDA